MTRLLKSTYAYTDIQVDLLQPFWVSNLGTGFSPATYPSSVWLNIYPVGVSLYQRVTGPLFNRPQRNRFNLVLRPHSNQLQSVVSYQGNLVPKSNNHRNREHRHYDQHRVGTNTQGHRYVVGKANPTPSFYLFFSSLLSCKFESSSIHSNRSSWSPASPL